MPIRFRCAYCNQLMGIARRKSGTVVRCPTCGGQVVVPNPNQQPAVPAPKKAGGLFENDDMDKLLQGGSGNVAPKGGRPQAASNRAARPMPAGPGVAADLPSVDVEPVTLPTGVLEGGGGISPGKFFLILIVLCVLLGLAFLAGFLVGRSSLE